MILGIMVMPGGTTHGTMVTVDGTVGAIPTMAGMAGAGQEVDMCIMAAIHAATPALALGV